jgi:pimeloyl-ACP methyl ester carboxylesterase
MMGLAIGVALLALAYFAAIFFLQRRMLFPHPPADAAAQCPADAQQVWLLTSHGRVEAWYLPPIDPVAERSPVIVYFHGNGELIDYWPGECAEPRSWGVGVLLVEYPGYGRSAGSPSQASVTAATLAAADWAAAQPTIDASKVVAYGRSLGGAAAAILAANRPTAALVFESTFTSVRGFAHGFMAPEFAVLDPFDTLALLKKYPGPVLVLHGAHDTLIPPSHGEALARATPRAELHLLDCGHNDCPRPWATLRAFLVETGVLETE